MSAIGRENPSVPVRARCHGQLVGTGVSSSVVFPGSIIDAGMLADAGLSAPKGTKGSSSDDVADAVVRVIRDDRGEVDAAELMVRFAAKVVGVFPRVGDVMGGRSRPWPTPGT